MTETNVNVQVGGPANPASVYKTVVLKGNQSFASQVTKTKTKYVVKYNFNLNNATVTIPANCLIEFDGGSISDGTLIGNNTILIYNQALNAIFSNVDRQGTFIYNNTLSADEEDLTEEGNLVKFKNKEYNATNYSGLGRVYLRKNIVNGVNTLTQKMINKANTIYHIQYDYALGEDITVPANCVLEFDGGSLSNGVLVGNNTGINVHNNASIFTEINIRGTWNVYEIYSTWFSDITNDNKLRELINLSNSSIQNTIYVKEGNYNVSATVWGDNILDLKSNTRLVLNGHIILATNDYNGYSIINIYNVKNVIVEGGGIIEGDLLEHTGGAEWGGGITIEVAENIKVNDITICNTAGDGIDISGDLINNEYRFSENVIISNFNINNNGRNGISITGAEKVIIENGSISDISTRQPRSAIDVEPNTNYHVKDVRISNIIVNNTHHTIFVNENAAKVDNVNILNCNLTSISTCVCFTKPSGNIILTGSYIKSTLGQAIQFPKNPDIDTARVVISNNIIDTPHRGLLIEPKWSVVKDNKIKCFSFADTVGDYSIIEGNEIIETLDVTSYISISGNYLKILNNTFRRKLNFISSNSIITNNIFESHITFDENNQNNIYSKNQFLNANGLYYNAEMLEIKETNTVFRDNIINRRVNIDIASKNISLLNNVINVTTEYLTLTITSNAYIKNNKIINSYVTPDYVVYFQPSSGNSIFAENTIESNCVKSIIFVNEVTANKRIIIRDNFYVAESSIPKLISGVVDTLIYKDYYNANKYNTLPDYTANKAGMQGQCVYYNGRPVYWDGAAWKERDGATLDVKRNGVTADRPAGNTIYVGFQYFDSDLGKPIYASAIAAASPYTVTWVDATGVQV